MGRTVKEKYPYPKSVFFIVSNEFCERFSFYGMRTVLALYLKNQLHFTDNTSTVIYHMFIMVCYFFPLLGAIVADSWLGKFKTILYLSIVYAIGNVVMSVAAIPHTLPPVAFTMIGLILIACGTGGIKPCVSAFGGDQFVLPEQETQLKKFFSVFYFAINSGSFLSTFITPLLREIQCFEQDTCYSLAFGVPALLMILALIIYIGGNVFYKIKKPEGNVVVKVAKCIGHAMTKKRQKEDSHWLDKAKDRYDKKFIEDIKAAFGILTLLIPLPVFWALFDQQGSRWTFQATRMNGEIGNFKLQPDQMQVVNPVLILAFIPLFDSVLYPLLGKCHLLKTPLQRLTVGGVLAAASFGISALVEMQLEPTYAILPQTGEGQLRLYNGLTSPLNISIPRLGIDSVSLESLHMIEELHVKTSGPTDFRLFYSMEGQAKETSVTVYEKEATSYIFMPGKIHKVTKEDIDKSDNGIPKIMIIYSDGSNFTEKRITVFEKGKEGVLYSVRVTPENPVADYAKIDLSSAYSVKVDGRVVMEHVEMKQGGCYVAFIIKDDEQYEADLLTITKPNTVHVLWLLPQYVVITAAEVMFSITGLEFSFTQAPVSMKSLIQAAWLITVALGNLIVVIVAEAKIFENQTYEFLLFGGLMLADMLIFALLAMQYKYVEVAPNVSPDEMTATDKAEGTTSDP